MRNQGIASFELSWQPNANCLRDGNWIEKQWSHCLKNGNLSRLARCELYQKAVKSLMHVMDGNYLLKGLSDKAHAQFSNLLAQASSILYLYSSNNHYQSWRKSCHSKITQMSSCWQAIDMYLKKSTTSLLQVWIHTCHCANAAVLALSHFILFLQVWKWVYAHLPLCQGGHSVSLQVWICASRSPLCREAANLHQCQVTFVHADFFEYEAIQGEPRTNHYMRGSEERGSR